MPNSPRDTWMGGQVGRDRHSSAAAAGHDTTGCFGRRANSQARTPPSSDSLPSVSRFTPQGLKGGNPTAAGSALDAARNRSFNSKSDSLSITTPALRSAGSTNSTKVSSTTSNTSSVGRRPSDNLGRTAPLPTSSNTYTTNNYSRTTALSTPFEQALPVKLTPTTPTSLDSSSHVASALTSISSVSTASQSLPSSYISAPMPLLSQRYLLSELIRSPRGNGITGIRNLGNTCFMNATLQCLLNTEPLAGYFLSGDYAKDINRKRGLKGMLSDSFQEIVQKYWSNDPQPVFPTRFKSAVGNWANTFAGYHQHDSQEFLRFVLDGLHEELNTVVTKPKYEELKDIDRESDADTAERWWRYHQARDDSFITKLFRGQFRSVVTCTKCKTVSKAFDPFLDLSLTIPHNMMRGSISIYDCLDRFVEEEKLKGTEQYRCAKCKKQQEATRQFSIYRCPEFLVVHFKRFAFNSLLRGKLGDAVQFPIDNFTLKNYVDEQHHPDGVTYDLYGVVHHMGSLASGHYTADGRNCLDNSWYHFDDSNAQRTSATERSLCQPSAYVLFYRKRLDDGQR